MCKHIIEVEMGVGQLLRGEAVEAYRRRRIGFFRTGGCFRLGQDRKGVATIEFALLGVPFFLLLFAVFETSLVFIGEMSLLHETERMAREVRTGKVAKASLSANQFREQLCMPITAYFDCSKLKIDLRSYSSYADLPVSAPVYNGLLKTDDFTFEPGSAGQIMQLRVFYEWPVFTDIMRQYLSNMSNNTHLVVASKVFKAEPF